MAHGDDLCRVLLAVDHRLTQAVVEDMAARGAFLAKTRDVSNRNEEGDIDGEPCSGGAIAGTHGSQRGGTSVGIATGGSSPVLPLYGDASRQVARDIRSDFEDLSRMAAR